MKQIVLLADAGPQAGLGHLSRCSAVAVALSERGVRARALGIELEGQLIRDGIEWQPVADLASLEPGPADAVLLDSYHVSDGVRLKLARSAALIVFCDEHPTPSEAVLSICAACAADGGPEASAAPGSTVLRGLAHACLRPAFWGLEARAAKPQVERVLVATGAGDPGAWGADVAAGLSSALPELQIALVRGPHAPQTAPPGVDAVLALDGLRDELQRSDLAVIGGGQTLLEAAACGTPSVAMILAPNQFAQAQLLADAGATRIVTSPAAAVASAVELVADPPARAELSRAAQQMVDGRGAQRVAAAIAAIGEGSTR